MKKAVIFDLDGTLLNTLGDLTDAVNYILRKYGYPERTEREVRSYLGNGARNLIELSLPEKIDGELFEAYLAEYMEYYKNHSTIKTCPYDGVLAVLGELKNCGITVAVVSNKPDAAVRLLCEKYFGDRVDFAVGDKVGLNRKPSADPVRYAMSETGCDSAIFIGDSEVDVLTAENAGLESICMTWGFRDRDVLEKAGARVFASSADELKKAIFDIFESKE